MLVDDDQELEHDDSGAWRLTIWGANPGAGSERLRRRRGDWIRVSREIWGSLPPSGGDHPSERAQPLLPLIELVPAPVEDIIPVPDELPPPSMEGLHWGEVDATFEPSHQDIWERPRPEPRRPAEPASTPVPASAAETAPSTPGPRYILPETWAAAPRRRSLRERWHGAA